MSVQGGSPAKYAVPRGLGVAEPLERGEIYAPVNRRRFGERVGLEAREGASPLPLQLFDRGRNRRNVERVEKCGE